MYPPLNDTDPWSYIRGLQPGSLCDWPGRISAVLFLGGCNLRCPTCHNARLAWTPEKCPPITRSFVHRFIRSRSAWLDGLVVSGGEPTCTPGLDELLEELAAFDLPIKLDTNGLQPEIVRSVLNRGLVQAVAVDVKGPWSKYPDLSGGHCSPQQAQDALEAIFSLAKEASASFFFRCTAVPALNSRDIEEVKMLLPSGFTLSVQTYIPPTHTTST